MSGRNGRHSAVLAVDIATCPDCGDVSHPGASVCEGCGTHLYVRQGSGRPFETQPRPRCTCAGAGLCVYCILQRLDEGKAL